MSDEEIELDEDEMNSLYEDNSDNLTPEEIFKLVLLNKKTKRKVWVQLKDEDGDEIVLADMMSELVRYLKDKISDEDGNQLIDQIMPLMSQALVSGLGRLTDLQTTTIFLANQDLRMIIICMMILSFSLYKMVQVKKLTINTIEEEVDEKEIEEIERKSKAISVASIGSVLGMSPTEILQHMVEKEIITEENLENILSEKRNKHRD